MKRLIYYIFILNFILLSRLITQENPEKYVKVTDPLVLDKLNKWQDLKFGLLMHWGTYSQWGVVESWSICNEDWITRDIDDYCEYKRKYKELKKTFNPVNFKPEKWVKAAKAAGMKYMIFTTKHHDGFCMFDTKTTDYKITSPECPFSKNPKANITKEIFDSFRKDGFLIGAYFSKPDWNTEFYWWPYYATPDRHVNYDPKKFPDRWKKYKLFTYAQIDELTSNYGKIDILWLDGAWIRPYSNMPKEYEEWAKKKDWNQDIDIPEIARISRKNQPGLIIVDRWVSGEYENYLTPEQKVPDKPLSVPWEACITMAPGWSFNKEHQYKDVRTLIHLLIDIVAKGGNFLLNIGPSPEGDWDPEAYKRLEGIGEWMKINNEAIYNSTPIAPYKQGKICFTQNKSGSEIFLLYLTDENENTLPESIEINNFETKGIKKINLLGSGSILKWDKADNKLLIKIPELLRKNPPGKYAWVIKITYIR